MSGKGSITAPKRIKYSTYLDHDVVVAVKKFAQDRKVPARLVIEAALKKCLPEKYHQEPEG